MGESESKMILHIIRTKSTSRFCTYEQQNLRRAVFLKH